MARPTRVAGTFHHRPSRPACQTRPSAKSAEDHVDRLDEVASRPRREIDEGLDLVGSCTARPVVRRRPARARRRRRRRRRGRPPSGRVVARRARRTTEAGSRSRPRAKKTRSAPTVKAMRDRDRVEHDDEVDDRRHALPTYGVGDAPIVLGGTVRRPCTSAGAEADASPRRSRAGRRRRQEDRPDRRARGMARCGSCASSPIDAAISNPMNSVTAKRTSVEDAVPGRLAAGRRPSGCSRRRRP